MLITNCIYRYGPPALRAIFTRKMARRAHNTTNRGPQPPMSTTNSRAEKRTGCIVDFASKTELNALRQHARHTITGGTLVGLDADGRLHFFSMSRRCVAVYDSAGDRDPTVVDLREQPIPDSIRAWGQHVYRQCGPWQDLRSGSRETRAQLEAGQ